jgi:hypothetical protein
LSVENTSSKSTTTPDEADLKHITERMKLMRQEFEELLFLKHAVETLKDFKKRLLQERCD